MKKKNTIHKKSIKIFGLNGLVVPFLFCWSCPFLRLYYFCCVCACSHAQAHTEIKGIMDDRQSTKHHHNEKRKTRCVFSLLKQNTEKTNK